MKHLSSTKLTNEVDQIKHGSIYISADLLALTLYRLAIAHEKVHKLS